MKKLFTLIVLCMALNAFASTFYVRQDGTGDFTTIQAAINASGGVDSKVYVCPGIYHENLDIGTRNVVIRSVEGLTGDPGYIDSTIIDGDGGDCLTWGGWQSNSIVEVRGFTFRNGQIGVHINDAANSKLINCKIYNNLCGLEINYSAYVYLSGVEIHDNVSSGMGGGLYISSETEVIFDPVNRCSIYNNYALAAQDIYVSYAQHDFVVYLDKATVINPGTYYVYYGSNYNDYSLQVVAYQAAQEEIQADLYVSPEGNDANNGLSPRGALKSLRLAMHRIASDSLNVWTIHLLEGDYFASDEELQLPVCLKSYVRLTGAGTDATIIHCDTYHSTIVDYYQDHTSMGNMTFTSEQVTRMENVIAMTLVDDVNVTNVRFDHLLTYEDGPFECRYATNVVLENVTFNDIDSYSNGTIYGYHFSGKLLNCTFNNIYGQYEQMSGINPHLMELNLVGDMLIENCIFNDMHIYTCYDQPMCVYLCKADNDSTSVNITVRNSLFINLWDQVGSVVSLTTPGPGQVKVYNCTFGNCDTPYHTLYLGGQCEVVNTVMSDQTDDEIWFYGSATSHLSIDYSDFPLGLDSIEMYGDTTQLNWGEHNIAGLPLFVIENGDDPLGYRMSHHSPCLNTGTPDTTGLSLPLTDLAGTPRVQNGRIEMGCYETGIVGTDPEPVTPAEVFAVNCYPNPFAEETGIDLNLPKAGKVNLNIYNIKGQLVQSLCDQPLGKGQHKYTWDGNDSRGKRCRQGLYLVVVKYDKLSWSQKLVLLR